VRIGISTRGLNRGSYAISSIVYHLGCEIAELAADRHEIYLYINDPDHLVLFSPWVHKRHYKLENRFVWDQVWLPYAMRKDKLDVALFMKGTLPVLLPCRGAVIFHDLGYFDESLRPYRFLETIYMRSMMSAAARKAGHVFADSEYTRQEAIRIMDLDPGKVSVCYQNCSPIYRVIEAQGELEAVRRRYGLPPKFMFGPISLSPRKNLGRILDAFERVRDQIPHHIVLTGGQSWRHRDLVKRIASEFNQRVTVLGEVPQEDMPALYNLADFTIYPSLLEGFGLPVLEAFRCGCPALTSDITSLPEVAGEAAYLVDPYDVGQIAEGMLRLASDSELRQDLVERGFQRARLFSWERTARIILDGIERLGPALSRTSEG
jgi:glycosyltransferase involved in cell wall biosynthesis